MDSTKKVSGQGCSETFVCRGRPRRERDWEKGRAFFPARLTKGGISMPDLELEKAVSRAVNEGTVKLVLSAPTRESALRRVTVQRLGET